VTDRDEEAGPSRWRDARADLDLLTPDDVCTLLKVKKSWLYDTVKSGSIETIKLGKQLRFRPSALARYLDATTSAACSALSR
jgi:excisionase family DNA binding protein